MAELDFAKGHALGNDYLVVDAAALPWPLSPARVRALCDRHRGIGSDGVLLGRLDDGRIRLRIFNPDGSEAEKSGNGLRIFGAWLHGRGLVGDAPFDVELSKDTVRMRVVGAAAGGALDLVVDMGRASFRGADVGFRPAPEEALGSVLELEGGERIEVNPVSLGNPHCVVWVDALERDDFLRRAPQLAVHPAFVAGTNVQFARVAGEDVLEAWIWERGAGETLASGSSACAVAAVAARQRRVPARALTVAMPGGRVGIELGDDWSVRLRGPAQIVYAGRVRAEVAAAWGADAPEAAPVRSGPA